MLRKDQRFCLVTYEEQMDFSKVTTLLFLFLHQVPQCNVIVYTCDISVHRCVFYTSFREKNLQYNGLSLPYLFELVFCPKAKGKMMTTTGSFRR